MKSSTSYLQAKTDKEEKLLIKRYLFHTTASELNVTRGLLTVKKFNKNHDNILHSENSCVYFFVFGPLDYHESEFNLRAMFFIFVILYFEVGTKISSF